MGLSGVAPEQYEALLSRKVTRVKQLIAFLTPPEPAVFPSQPTGFRLRAEFRMWHADDKLHYVMFHRESPKTPVFINEFPIADERIQRLMPVLLDLLNNTLVLGRKLFQVEFLATLSGELLVTLVYHRPLDHTWESAALQLLLLLQRYTFDVSLVGRSRGQKIVLGRDYVREMLHIHGREYRLRQYEQSFSQPNGLVNISMVEWACEQVESGDGDLLELYCGNGNFTLPLSRYFGSVIATETAKLSFRSAVANLTENGIQNVYLVRLSAQEVAQAMNAVRAFRRLSTLPKPLEHFNLRTLFVDPPRAGLDDYTVAMARRFPKIIYMSCNVETLAENLRVLNDSHRIEQFALFDQFPYTDHIECGVVLKHI